MKRLATAALALSLLVVPLAMADSRHDGGRHWERSSRASESPHGRNDEYARQRYRNEHRSNWRYDRDDRRSHWRDDRYHNDRHRYDRHRYHGHRYNRPRSSYDHYRLRDDHRSWRHRRDYRHYDYRVPRSYFGRPHIVQSYGYHRLRRPPHGCHWVRVDRDLVLAAVATGIVLDVIYDYF